MGGEDVVARWRRVRQCQCREVLELSHERGGESPGAAEARVWPFVG